MVWPVPLCIIPAVVVSSQPCSPCLLHLFHAHVCICHQAHTLCLQRCLIALVSFTQTHASGTTLSFNKLLRLLQGDRCIGKASMCRCKVSGWEGHT